MREMIFILNRMVAIGATSLAAIGLVIERSGRDVPVVLVGLGWIACAVRLKASGLWAWIGSLIAAAAIVVVTGAETVRYIALILRADAGDRSVELDPTTIGMPLFGSALATLGAAGFLVALLSLPLVRDKPTRPLQPTPASRSDSIPPPLARRPPTDP